MPPAPAMAAIVTLAVLLAIASATAGALWWRVRSAKARAGRPAGELAERLGRLEEILARIEGRTAAITPGSSHPAGPRAARRADRAEESAVAGPTLIAVPDLGAPAGDAAGSDELGRRFGAIWELADAGASAEAIARATGQPIGQVELILGLRRQRAAGGRS